MNKTFLSGLLALAGIAFGMQAEVLSPYDEPFENPTFRPRGWLHASASSYASGSYAVNAEGGHAGGCITANQYSNYWSSYYNNYNYIDLLITPPVTGDVSIWVRKNGSDPSLTFYKITDLGAISTSLPILEGTDKNMVEGLTIDEWTQITVPGVPADTYLGIRANNLDLDDFSAASANVTYRASIIADVKNTTGSTTLEADADNNVTIKFSVSLENNGDIEFPATAGGFKIELVNKALGDKVVGTGSIDDAIPFGTTVSKDFSMTFPAELAPDTKSNSFGVNISSDKTGSVQASLAWFTIIPYAPVSTFMFAEDNDKNQSSYNDVNITEDITVGAGAAGTSRTLYMWNSGTAPMNVTSVSVKGDFTVDVSAFTLAKGEKKAVTVGLKGEPGYKTGSVTFNIDGVGEKIYGLSGQVVKDGAYVQDFEADALPAGLISGNSWKLTATPDALATLGGKHSMYYQSTSSVDKFIMPKITFGEGETLAFMATKTDNTSSTLKVYTSPDRVTWTEALAISTRDENPALCFGNDKPTGSGYGTYEYKIFNAPMPEGDVYVAFEAGGARVDNISGGTLTPVSHDIYVTKVSIPDGANVNTRYMTSVTVQNILAEPETGYDIILEVGGKEVARASGTPELETNVPAVFDLCYTPHEVGEYDACILFVSGDFRLPLKEFRVAVEEEKSEAVYQVGNYKITTTDPFNTFYGGSQCQIIYRSEDLGMERGVKIIGFTFNGYCTDVAKKHVKVWAQNTTDSGYDFADVQPASIEDMTLVYEGDYTFEVAGDNSAKVYEPVMTINFTTPVEYAGDNLRFMFDLRDIDGETEDKHVFFTVDNSAYDYWNDKFDDRVITAKVEFAEDLDDNPSWNGYKAGYPVTYFKVSKDVVVVRGALTNDFDNAVEGASVKFVSDDLLYSAVSDAEGLYSMSVGNLDHVYTLTVEAEGYETVTVENITLDPKSAPETVHDFRMLFTDREATLSGRIINTFDDYKPLAGADVVLEQGDVKAQGVTDEEGRYSVTVPDFTGEYTFTVLMNDEPVYTDKYTFTAKTGVLDLRIGYDSVESIASDDASPAGVVVRGNTVIVSAPRGKAVTLYSASGILCETGVSSDGTVQFDNVASGVYVVAGRKIVVR